jgi:hypothetical protein
MKRLYLSIVRHFVARRARSAIRESVRSGAKREAWALLTTSHRWGGYLFAAGAKRSRRVLRILTYPMSAAFRRTTGLFAKASSLSRCACWLITIP